MFLAVYARMTVAWCACRSTASQALHVYSFCVFESVGRSVGRSTVSLISICVLNCYSYSSHSIRFCVPCSDALIGWLRRAIQFLVLFSLSVDFDLPFACTTHTRPQTTETTKSNKSREREKNEEKRAASTIHVNKLNANSLVFICRSFELLDMIVEMSQIIPSCWVVRWGQFVNEASAAWLFIPFHRLRVFPPYRFPKSIGASVRCRVFVLLFFCEFECGSPSRGRWKLNTIKKSLRTHSRNR